jgi:hypothetical protein
VNCSTTFAVLRQLTLRGLGEPLLAPWLLDMVRYANDRACGSASTAWTAAQDAGLALRLPESAPGGHAGCTWPWDSAYVTCQGVVQPCCMVMSDGRVVLVRLDQQRFSEISAGLESWRSGNGAAAPIDRACVEGVRCISASSDLPVELNEISSVAVAVAGYWRLHQQPHQRRSM